MLFYFRTIQDNVSKKLNNKKNKEGSGNKNKNNPYLKYNKQHESKQIEIAEHNILRSRSHQNSNKAKSKANQRSSSASSYETRVRQMLSSIRLSTSGKGTKSNCSGSGKSKLIDLRNYNRIETLQDLTPTRITEIDKCKLPTQEGPQDIGKVKKIKNKQVLSKEEKAINKNDFKYLKFGEAMVNSASKIIGK